MENSYNGDTIRETEKDLRNKTYAEFVDASTVRYDNAEKILSGEMRLGYVTSLTYWSIFDSVSGVTGAKCYFDENGNVIKVYSVDSDSYIYEDGEIKEN